MDCKLFWCGKYIQSWENQLHKHGHFQILAVVSGSATVTLDQNTFTAPKGSVVILPPNRPHKVNCCENGLQVTDAKFTLEGGELQTALLKLPALLSPQSFDKIVCLFENILSESSQQPPCFNSMIHGLFLQILVELVRTAPSAQLVLPSHSLPQSSWKGIDLQAVTDYVHTNYACIGSLDDLSSFVHINKTTLTELFKYLFGMPPMRYVRSLRLQQAKKLLAETDQSICKIAEQIGYQNVPYFSRDFKRHTGVTPMLYRIQNGKNRYFTYCTETF